jgi:hypothetical protein
MKPITRQAINNFLSISCYHSGYGYFRLPDRAAGDWVIAANYISPYLIVSASVSVSASALVLALVKSLVSFVHNQESDKRI